MPYKTKRKLIIIADLYEVVIDDRNKVIVGCDELNIHPGDNFRFFYINNKDKYSIVRGRYFSKYYTPKEKAARIKEKSPLIDKLIKTFDLEY